MPLTNETEIAPRVAAPIQPHARALLERARKLESLPLIDLAARVADGLARLRLAYGLETRALDPVRALFAALPRTELARRSTDLTVELEAARQAVLDRERAAAEVERRSESLKEALRDRSADLASALSRADEVPAVRRALESARAQLVETERERDGLRAELARALDEARVAANELDAARRRALERAADHEREFALERADRARPDPRLDIARSALAAAAEREAARARLARLEREAATDRTSAIEAELGHVRRERDTAGDELLRLQQELEAKAALHRSAIDGYERTLAESGRLAEPMRRELEWRRREMDALRAAATGVRWKLLGGDAAERVARWNREGTT